VATTSDTTGAKSGSDSRSAKIDSGDGAWILAPRGITATDRVSDTVARREMGAIVVPTTEAA
jgi:hypothetical protein